MDDHRFSFTDAVYILRRRFRGILLILGLSLLTVGAYLVVAPTKYSAVTRVLVSMGREKLEDIGLQTHNSNGNVVFQERAQNINNEVEILRDPALIRQALPELKARLQAIHTVTSAPNALGVVVEGAKAISSWLRALPEAMTNTLVNLGLIKKIDPDVELGISFYKALSIFGVKETDVIAVGFTWDDPVFAADALNIYLREYQLQHLRVYAIKKSVSFFENQLRGAQDELRASEAARADFMRNGGLSNFDTEKGQLLVEIAQIRREANQATLDQDATQLRLNAINGRRNGVDWIETPDSADSTPSVQALDQSFVRLLDQRNRLVSIFRSDTDQVRNVQNQIAQLRSQKFDTLSVLYHVRLLVMAEKIASLEAEIAGKSRSLNDLTERNADWDSIQRRLSRATELVAEYRHDVERLQVNSEMNSEAFSSVRALSEATPPELPSSPKRMLILGLALGFGLLVGVAYALVAELFGRTFHQPNQVTRVLGLPVLANVPQL